MSSGLPRIDLLAPAWLLLVVLLPFLLLAGRPPLRWLQPRQRRYAYAARGLILLALLAALAQPRLGTPDDRLALALVVDISDSVDASQRAAMLGWIRSARERAGAQDSVELLQVGSAAAAAQGASPDAEATNLADAIRLGQLMLGDSGPRRLVLLTDGQQNEGDALTAARAAAQTGVEVAYVRPDRFGLPAEVSVRSIEVPAASREGEVVTIEAVLESTVQTGAGLRLRLDDRPIFEQWIDLQPGLTRVPVSAGAATNGVHRLQVEIEPFQDARPENNRLGAGLVTRPAGAVLLLEPRAGEAAELADQLRGLGLRVDVRPPSAVPPTASALSAYDTILLANVPATALSLDQQATLVQAVEDLGRGLVVTGGPTSYSVGAYVGSPIGDLLPVDSEPPARSERGSVALVLVVDRSGSMDCYRCAASKMAMAREAAALAVEGLRAGDQLGVLAFDGRYEWIQPLVSLGGPADLNAAKARIAGIQPNGSTAIFPALEAAYEAIQSAPTRLKHILLLTDGQDSYSDYASLVSRFRDQNVTLTTIGVGSDTDRKLLARIADLAEGRSYFTERPTEIPRIVTREATIVTRSALVEGVIQPRADRATGPLAVLRGRELPLLNGYVATTPRPSAQNVLVSDRGDPLLATWQFGLGRVAAWTTDFGPGWSSAWLADPVARSTLAQTVRWSMPREADPSFQLRASVDGQRVRLEVEALDPRGQPAAGLDTRARITTPSGERVELPLPQVGPGLYSATSSASADGTYAVEAVELANGIPVRSDLGSFVVDRNLETRTLGANRPLLAQVAAATGGRELSEPSEALARPNDGSVRWQPLWPWLLVLAGLLLPLDVALRRFPLFRR